MMIFGRSAIYFDEVARRGSIRRASENLHIAASAIDRQILQLEQQVGTPLFERMPQGLRLTAAGEILIDSVRRWRREFARANSQIDDLRGLRRGDVGIAIVEGAAEFLAKHLASFQARYPAIAYRIKVSGAQGVIDLVMAGEHDLGITFNPPDSHTLRVERTMIYQMGMIVRPDHPLAHRTEVSLAECAQYPLIVPDESISLRAVLDQIWAKTIGGSPRYAVEASGIGLIKSLTMAGIGIGMLTAFDCFAEIEAGSIVLIPLTDLKLPLSVLSVVSAGSRTLSVPASLFIQHLSLAMTDAPVPVI